MLPILYQSPDFILYSYPLLMGIGWGIAYQIFFSFLDASVSKIKGQFLFWGVFIFAWLGSKLLFYWTFNTDNQDFLGELSFWMGGGFVFYGGLIFALGFLSLWKLFDKKLSLNQLWSMLPALAIGHAVGRMGCFLAGCCYGRPTSLFWGVFMHDHYRHPTQLIEALSLLFIGLVLLKWRRPKRELLAFYFCSYGMLRLIVEALRGDEVRGQWGFFTPSQWISCVLISAGVLLFIQILKVPSTELVK